MNKAFYGEIKKILSDARNKVYQTANFAWWKLTGRLESLLLKNKTEKNVQNTEQDCSRNCRIR